MQRDRSWLSPVVGLCIVALLVHQLGAGPFLDALRHLDAVTVATGGAIAVVTTVCGAWRWVLVARGLGAELSLRSAVAESYRSQFLNVTLPGGVLGDLHRGVRHGRSGGDLGRGLRSVVWERAAGQAVLAVITAAVLLDSSGMQGLVAPGPAVLAVALGVVVVAAVLAAGLAGALVAVVGRERRRAVADRVVCVARAAWADVRAGLLGRHTWPGVVGSSTVVVLGHAATFVVAARAAGVTAPASRLVPLALVVLVAMSVPLNVAGWGPREGAAAWAFAAVGLGAAGGVATAVVYGVMALVSSLPGAVVVALSRRLPASRERLVPIEGVARG
ncbi:lysylphosphatidylglycerol synthase transmembrane domain-containing protein [Terrabacter aerolatus]|uniref:Dolichol-P-glucose synthetase-like protein n=1 Tax=Terrabacter aerolatus TaxID=422442 RepID=A0A512D5F6_9MICO|nr:lysylphosphatidylglycerol synthase transmembrane domain-containing protein [Terrabacter aerolatus]GEO31510.1 hypothetical protein TAE01_33200 [Terrabacter aerolatus]